MSIRRWFGALCLMFVVAVASVIAVRAPFEYDEAVYAGKARALRTGSPSSAWYVQRAPLLPILSAPIGRARSETPFRAFGVLAGVAALAAVWRLGGRGRAGLLAAAVFGFAPVVLVRAGQFMTDLPAAALLFAMVAVLVSEAEAGPSARLLVVAPLAAAAFYLRYASLVPIAVSWILAAVVWRRQLWRARALVAGSLALFVALMVPHLVYSARAYGEPWSVVLRARATVRASVPGSGLADYARWLPFVLAGPLAGVVMLVGIASALRRPARVEGFLIATGVGTLVVLGVTTHAEPRFALFAVGLLVVAGARAAEPWLARNAKASIVAGIVGATCAVSVVGSVVATHGAIARRAAVVSVGRRLGQLAHHPCMATATQIPLIAWYSNCLTQTIADTRVRPDYVVVLQPMGSQIPLRWRPVVGDARLLSRSMGGSVYETVG